MGIQIKVKIGYKVCAKKLILIGVKRNSLGGQGQIV
jgi:hypothetical protein